MPSNQDRLDQWWASLSADQQQEALAAQQSGQLTPSLVASLQKAGAISSGKGAGDALPGGVDQYLKARH